MRRAHGVALVELQDQLNAFFVSAPAGLAIFDAQFRYVRVNETLARLHGLAVEQHLGKRFRDIAPKIAPAVEPILRKVLSTGVPALNIEITGEAPVYPGEERHWVASYTPIANGDGTPRTIGAIVVDVTERHRMERELRESEHFARTVIASVNEGVMVFDRELRFRMWNTFMETLTGMSAEQVINVRAMDLFPHIVEQGIDRLLRRALAGETVMAPPHPYYVPGTTKAGWVAGLYSPHTSSTGEILGVVGTIRDVTEQWRAEEALRESEEHYRELFENANDVVYTVNPAGYFTSINRAAERVTGYTNEEASTMHFSQVVAPESLAVARRMVAQKFAGGGPTTYEVTIVTKDGRRVPLEISSRLVTRNGKPVGVQGIGRDINRRKLAEDEIRTRTSLMGRLIALTESLNRPLTSGEIVTTIGEGAISLSGADRIAVFLRRTDGEIVCPWSKGLSSDYIDQVLAHMKELPVGDLMEGADSGLVPLRGGRVVDEITPFLFADIQSLPPEVLQARLAASEGYRALGNWPLTYEGQAIGVVSCYYPESGVIFAGPMATIAR